MSNLEIKLKDDTLITSKTDLKGIVTYCNKDFLTYSGFSEREILGKPHNIVRHNHMPKAVFKFLWQGIAKGDEFFAIVKNKNKTGRFYWVFANITSSKDAQGNIIGYYSVRRKANPNAIAKIENLYNQMLSIEQSGSIPKSLELLESTIKKANISYNHYILNLQKGAL